ncbi:MAG: hypothetical protein QOD99_2636 [Chthoniobacter sp.]|nr:hypothetical protein [Chthoniobacter sp.]
MPDNTRCTIITTGKAAANAKPEESKAGESPQAEENAKPGEKAKPSAAIIIEEKMGTMVHVLTVRANGAREEKWTNGGLLASMRAGAKELTFTTGGVEALPMPTWVSADTFSDIKKQGDKSYLLFQTRALETGREVVTDMERRQNYDSLKVEVIATIDEATRLPLAVKEGELTTTYKYEPLAPGTQIIPAAIQAAIAEREQKFKATTRKSVTP